MYKDVLATLINIQKKVVLVRKKKQQKLMTPIASNKLTVTGRFPVDGFQKGHHFHGNCKSSHV